MKAVILVMISETFGVGSINIASNLHLFELCWFAGEAEFVRKKKELRALVLKRKHEQYMKDGTTNIRQVRDVYVWINILLESVQLFHYG